jgi:hypothetical protein
VVKLRASFRLGGRRGASPERRGVGLSGGGAG